MGRILVTGGMGAIGSAAVRWLVEAGHRPVIFDRQGSNELVADLLGEIDIEVGDLRSWGRVAEVIRRDRLYLE